MGPFLHSLNKHLFLPPTCQGLFYWRLLRKGDPRRQIPDSDYLRNLSCPHFRPPLSRTALKQESQDGMGREREARPASQSTSAVFSRERLSSSGREKRMEPPAHSREKLARKTPALPPPHSSPRASGGFFREVVWKSNFWELEGEGCVANRET